MPSVNFPTAFEQVLQGDLLWLTDDIRGVLLLEGTTISTDSMVYLSDIPADRRIVMSDPLTGKTVSGGVMNSNAAYFEDFIDTLARPCGSMVLVKYDVLESNTLLIAHFEGTSGFPFYGAGRNYYVSPLGSEGWVTR